MDEINFVDIYFDEIHFDEIHFDEIHFDGVFVHLFLGYKLQQLQQLQWTPTPMNHKCRINFLPVPPSS